MEGKNRLVFILLIGVIAVAALLASFGPALFSGQTPRVVLPNLSEPQGSRSPDPDNLSGDRFVPVSVTADTVQSVIASLDRPASYARTLTLTTYAGGKEYQAYARVYVDGAWTRVELEQQNQPKGVQHTIVGDGRFYRWYGDGNDVVEGTADQWDADLAQRIPSYQDIIDLDKSTISATGYMEKGGVPCIYVEVRVEELGYLERYWVSASGGFSGSGLLLSCETEKDGEIVLRMTSSPPESPLPAGTLFSLPDGSVLHRAGESES